MASCKPINIFSPLVDPSNMGNDAKMDAGYNALADGNYDSAIDYFGNVIKSASGDQLTDAYVGRAAAYMHKGAPGIDDVVSDMMNGELEFDSPGDVITVVKGGNDYAEFFDNISSAADDYNAAIDNHGSAMDRGTLVEAYQANMMAATGVGATSIALTYNTSPWDDMTPIGLDSETNALVSGGLGHPNDIDTWDDAPGGNGLRAPYVDGLPAEAEMLGYMQGAFDALTAMQSDPPLDMDVPDLKSNLQAWATNGLGQSLN
jgi:hypothetical protein